MTANDPAVDAAFDVGGVREHVGELDVVQWPVPERPQIAVELGADPADFALGDPGADTERLDEVVPSSVECRFLSVTCIFEVEEVAKEVATP